MKYGLLKPSPSKKQVRQRKTILTIAAFLTVLGLGSLVVPSAWAMWTAQAQLQGTITVKDSPLQINGSVSIANQSKMISHSTLQDARLITVTNTVRGKYTDPYKMSMRLSASENNALSKSTLEVFAVSSAEQCSVSATPSSPQTGTWVNGVTVSTTSLTPNSTALYCARTTVTSWEDLATTSGTYTITPKADVTFSIGTLQKTASNSNSLKSVAIYPAITSATAYYQLKIGGSTNKCVQADISADTTKTDRERIIARSFVAANCLSSAQLATTAGNIQKLTFPNAATSKVFINTGFFTELYYTLIFPDINMMNFQEPKDSVGAKWRLESRPDGSWQIVNSPVMNSPALCLTVPASGDEATLTECLDSANQYFQPTKTTLSRSGIADTISESTDSENDDSTEDSSTGTSPEETPQSGISTDLDRPQSGSAKQTDALLDTESQ